MSKKKTSNWHIYLITNGKSTYVGSTTDVARRLRQHNGEIRGGARATSRSKGKWRVVCYLSGFQGRSSACRWEALVKKRSRGLEGRYMAMHGIYMGSCPAGRKQYIPPAELSLVISASGIWGHKAR